jgi:putative membrane protein insertion efficiency factor
VTHFLVRLPQRVLLALVRAYRLLLSPALGASCRFEPTCSAYALQALQRHGAAAGSYLTVCRLARCHPWCEPGFDPVPIEAPGLFSRLVSDAPSRRKPTPSPLPDKNSP